MSKRVRFFVFFVGLIILGFLLGEVIKYDFNVSKTKSDITSFKGGKFLQLVYIGSDGCSYCSDSLNEEVLILKEKLNDYSHKNGISFFSTGISTDIDPEKGLSFLKKSGYYDELITGAGWYNLGVNYYIWNKFDQEGYVPQILILSNRISVESSLEGILNITRDDSILFKFDNLEEIQDFKLEEISFL